jgi:hypothetical protein
MERSLAEDGGSEVFVTDATFADCEAAWMERHVRWLGARAAHVAACQEATRGAATKRALARRPPPSRDGHAFSPQEDDVLRRIWGVLPPASVKQRLNRRKWSDIARRASELGILLRPLCGLVSWSAAAAALRVSRSGLRQELGRLGLVPRVVRLGDLVGLSGTYARPSQWAAAYGALRRRLVGFGAEAVAVARRRALRVLEPLVRVPQSRGV